MPKFELNRLIKKDRDSLLAEIRRVADLVEGPLTQEVFNSHAKISSGTIRSKLGGWEHALSLAGVGNRFFGPTRFQKGHKRTKRLTEEQLIAELRIVGAKLGKQSFTQKEFERCSNIHPATIAIRFKSWSKAMSRAGLQVSKLGRRYSEDEYFENLLNVWSHYGRQPKYNEMDSPPSIISSGAYEHKWATWTKALLAFVERANSDVTAEIAALPESSISQEHLKTKPPKKTILKSKSVRSISLSVRFRVLNRDRFRCRVCGASPATDLQCRLHVDHIKPVANDGTNSMDNLQTLCQKCNLGKRDN